MTFLTIDGKEYEAKCTFKFERLADKKYSEEDKDGNKTGGFMSIYMNLLDYSNTHLLAFWDCALDYLVKDKPSLESVETAIEKRIEEDGDTEKLFKEAFKAVDESGFFKRKAKNFWNDFEMMKESGKTKEEKEQNKTMYNRLITSRDELKA